MLSRIITSSIQRCNVRAMSTAPAVWINKDTRTIVQGFTGKQVSYSYRNVIIFLLICTHHRIYTYIFFLKLKGNLPLRASNCIQQRHRRRWGLSWQRGYRKFRSSCVQFGQRSQRRHRRECQVSWFLFCALLLLPLLVALLHLFYWVQQHTHVQPPGVCMGF